VKKKLEERAQYKEALEAAAQKAFSSFLSDITSNYYGIMRSAVNNLAIADCLFSFALVAHEDGYVKPEFTDEDTLEIVEGRHPMAEALHSDPFVPNTIRMGNGNPRSKIITGPNMGGKSCSVRMIALIAIMAQIGSYVPAKSVQLGMLDSVLTRMGGESFAYALEVTYAYQFYLQPTTRSSEVAPHSWSKCLRLATYFERLRIGALLSLTSSEEAPPLSMG
jgi:DNA mismatch repair protein MSH3